MASCILYKCTFLVTKLTENIVLHSAFRDTEVANPRFWGSWCISILALGCGDLQRNGRAYLYSSSNYLNYVEVREKTWTHAHPQERLLSASSCFTTLILWTATCCRWQVVGTAEYSPGLFHSGQRKGVIMINNLLIICIKHLVHLLPCTCTAYAMSVLPRRKTTSGQID